MTFKIMLGQRSSTTVQSTERISGLYSVVIIELVIIEWTIIASLAYVTARDLEQFFNLLTSNDSQNNGPHIIPNRRWARPSFYVLNYVGDTAFKRVCHSWNDPKSRPVMALFDRSHYESYYCSKIA